MKTGELLLDPISLEAAVDCLKIAFSKSGRTGRHIVSIAAGTDMLEEMKRIRAFESALRDALDGGEWIEMYF